MSDNNYWEMQRQINLQGLVADGVQLGQAWRQKWANDRAQKEFDVKVRAAYAKALEEGKTSGEMPFEFQTKVGIDELTRHIGIKAVALRELGKRAPTHPMVVSQTCRAVVGKVTKINFNRAGRPDEADLNDFAPDDVNSNKIFTAFPK